MKKNVLDVANVQRHAALAILQSAKAALRNLNIQENVPAAYRAITTALPMPSTTAE